jgi:ribosomal protein S27E
MPLASQLLPAQQSHDARPERVPVSVHCPGCGRSRLIYTTVRAHLQVMLICPACRGTSSEPRR